jgi:hypothetical protein
VRLGNKRLQRSLGRVRGGVRLLEVAGFERKRLRGGGGSGGGEAAGQQHEDEELVLVRDDVGLLWLGKSLLEQHRAALGEL